MANLQWIYRTSKQQSGEINWYIIDKTPNYLEEVCDATFSNGGTKSPFRCMDYGTADEKTYFTIVRWASRWRQEWISDRHWMRRWWPPCPGPRTCSWREIGFGEKNGGCSWACRLWELMNDHIRGSNEIVEAVSLLERWLSMSSVWPSFHRPYFLVSRSCAIPHRIRLHPRRSEQQGLHCTSAERWGWLEWICWYGKSTITCTQQRQSLNIHQYKPDRKLPYWIAGTVPSNSVDLWQTTNIGTLVPSWLSNQTCTALKSSRFSPFIFVVQRMLKCCVSGAVKS